MWCLLDIRSKARNRATQGCLSGLGGFENNRAISQKKIRILLVQQVCDFLSELTFSTLLNQMSLWLFDLFSSAPQLFLNRICGPSK
jgi:hypothetical protein